MIPYSHADEKETILYYAELLSDSKTKSIIENDSIKNNDEAIHLAEFFWKMAKASNDNDTNSEYILEKIISSLMAYYRTTGYEETWEEIADKQ